MSDKTDWQYNYYEIALLALVLYREARGESLDARLAVAHTVMNRVARPSWWGGDVVDVITKKWQYSSLTDPNDRQLTVWPRKKDVAFRECLEIASSVLRGAYQPPLPGIDSYFDDSLQGEARPKWAKQYPERFVGKIGRLNFYNLDQDIEREPPV